MPDRATAPRAGAEWRSLGPVEPVHWGARLVRAPSVVYTEVADTPVLVRVDDAEMQPLPPAWAAVWAALDGRTAAEALGVDPATVDPITSRNLIEALRRLKAKRLVADVDSLGPDDRAAATTALPDEQPVAGAADVVLRGHLERAPGAAVLIVPARPTLRTGARPSTPTSPDSADSASARSSTSPSADPAASPTLNPPAPTGPDVSTSPYDAHDDEQTEPVTVHVTEADGTLIATVDGEPVAIVTVSSFDDPDGDATRSIEALADLLAALAEPSCLAEPGVVDLLAALAETVTHPSR